MPETMLNNNGGNDTPVLFSTLAASSIFHYRIRYFLSRILVRNIIHRKYFYFYVRVFIWNYYIIMQLQPLSYKHIFLPLMYCYKNCINETFYFQQTSFFITKPNWSSELLLFYTARLIAKSLLKCLDLCWWTKWHDSFFILHHTDQLIF